MFIHLFIHLFVCSFVRSFICSFTRLFIHSIIHSFIQCMHSFILLYLCSLLITEQHFTPSIYLNLNLLFFLLPLSAYNLQIDGNIIVWQSLSSWIINIKHFNFNSHRNFISFFRFHWKCDVYWQSGFLLIQKLKVSVFAGILLTCPKYINNHSIHYFFFIGINSDSFHNIESKVKISYHTCALTHIIISL